jgi:hypothetical protein
LIQVNGNSLPSASIASAGSEATFQNSTKQMEDLTNALQDANINSAESIISGKSVSQMLISARSSDAENGGVKIKARSSSINAMSQQASAPLAAETNVEVWNMSPDKVFV